LLASEQVVPVKQESRVERFARYVRNVGVTSTLLAAASSVYPYISSYLPSLSAYVPAAATQLAIAAAGVVTVGVGETFNYLARRDRADAEAKAPPRVDSSDEFVDASDQVEPWMLPYQAALMDIEEEKTIIEIPVEKKGPTLFEQMTSNLLAWLKNDFSNLPGASELIVCLEKEPDSERVIREIAGFINRIAVAGNSNNLSNDEFDNLSHFRTVLSTVSELKRTESGNFRVESPDLEEEREAVETFSDNGIIPQRLIYRGPGNDLHVHPVLSKDTYNDLLQITDLSYKVAAEFRAPSQNDKWREMKEDLMADLVGRGWRHFATIDGKTGFNNANDDKTAIVMINRERNLVVAGFHGSISLDFGMFDFWNGDWAANWDSETVDATLLGIEGA
jgi:hypothetical protein